MNDINKEYLFLKEEIEKILKTTDKPTKIRIKNWIYKLDQVSGNEEWEKNRNYHSILIFDSLLTSKFHSPYDKNPTDNHVETINKSIVKSRISKKFISFIVNHYKSMINNGEVKEEREKERLLSMINGITSVKSKSSDNDNNNDEISHNKEEKGKVKEEVEFKYKIQKLKEDIFEKKKIFNEQKKVISKLKKEIISNEEIIRSIMISNKKVLC